jgi:hypothetical protein
MTALGPLAATSFQSARGDERESGLVHEHGKTLSAADKAPRAT